ncbi:MAG: Phenylalanine--tRNA ligase alpha subunit [Chlamydiia bacterium]|nr:Phenylalanine--tRNA ligase alpha subunit [Chlamydiia bacterium]
MDPRIQSILNAFGQESSTISDSKQLQELRIKYLGKKGEFAKQMQNLRDLPPDEKRVFGQSVNKAKEECSQVLEGLEVKIYREEQKKQFAKEKIDITRPGRRKGVGRSHPLSSMIGEMSDVLIHMGFSIQTGPEMESDYYNYGGLNYPPDHPARDMQDTFYLDKDTQLRSHCTSIQQRMMENHKPPIRVAVLGKCYRNETVSSRSHVLFHQCDGLYIAEKVSFADLLSTLKELYSRIFQKEVMIRTRASYFPFVEPGMEVDIGCLACEQKGCMLCKQSGWLEVCGAGMVHPEVLAQGGLDPDRYSGFAWGGGVERVFMLRNGIGDIRSFLNNDMRFLEQFR